MKFFTTDPYGITLVEPSAEQREAVLRSVIEDPEPEDFPEAYLSGPGGVVVGYRSDGCLLYEAAGTVVRYRPHTDVQTAMAAWNLLIRADWNGLDKMNWKSIE